jgi:hypothetical protein
MQPQYPQGPRPAQNQQPYPQPGPQHPQPGAPYPQPGYGPQQYQGMPQMPYYPPPKKGMPGWAIALIVVGVLFFFIIPILALAAIPLLTSNTRDARRAEGEQMLGSLRGLVRITYAKQGTHTGIRTLTGSENIGGCGASPMELRGKYYVVRDNVESRMSGARLTCDPTTSQSDGSGHVDFEWSGGEGRYTWDP